MLISSNHEGYNMIGLFQKQIMNLKDQQSRLTKMNDNSYERLSRQIILSLHISCTVFHKSTHLGYPPIFNLI